MSLRTYALDAELKIWRTPAHDTIAYSDGAGVENHLLQVLRQCRDLSSNSGEIRQHIVDWPSEYHLSPLRHVLLRPFPIGPSDRILELGCGCGAITRYLGETGATVVAVEGSAKRAQIAAERCRDLPNVSVYCDNLVHFASMQHFSLVTLIGVLEYAPAFVNHPDPAAVYLSRAASHLSADGRILIAIENQLGLKYFAGCAEDHTGEPFLGIEGRYADSRTRTFGRHDLADRLRTAGLKELDWLFPFPDYKLPQIIVSGAGMADPDFDLATVLARSCSRDYGGKALRSFDEVLARRVAWQNGCLGELANQGLRTRTS